MNSFLNLKTIRIAIRQSKKRRFKSQNKIIQIFYLVFILLRKFLSCQIRFYSIDSKIQKFFRIKFDFCMMFPFEDFGIQINLRKHVNFDKKTFLKVWGWDHKIITLRWKLKNIKWNENTKESQQSNGLLINAENTWFSFALSKKKLHKNILITEFLRRWQNLSEAQTKPHMNVPLSMTE